MKPGTVDAWESKVIMEAVISPMKTGPSMATVVKGWGLGTVEVPAGVVGRGEVIGRGNGWGVGVSIPGQENTSGVLLLVFCKYGVEGIKVHGMTIGGSRGIMSALRDHQFEFEVLMVLSSGNWC